MKDFIAENCPCSSKMAGVYEYRNFAASWSNAIGSLAAILGYDMGSNKQASRNGTSFELVSSYSPFDPARTSNCMKTRPLQITFKATTCYAFDKLRLIDSLGVYGSDGMLEICCSYRRIACVSVKHINCGTQTIAI